MTKEEQILAKRFVDLSRLAQQKDIVTFSSFLNLNELNIFHSVASELYTSFELSGGFAYAERQMIAFIPDALCYSWNYPIVCCRLEPLHTNFMEPLTHRDVLGSLMHLGIDRGRLGDILIEEKYMYLFCHEQICDFLLQELTKIKHTSIRIQRTSPQNLALQPRLEACQAVIASNRLDNMVAAICHISRTQAAELVKNGKVFINNRVVISTTYVSKNEEIISIRSVGRFRFEKCTGETKKGRCKIEYSKYI